MLGACAAGPGSASDAPTACERAVRAAADVPAEDATAADLDGAIAVCESLAELEAAAARWPGALDGGDAEERVADRCRSDPVIALSSVCAEVLAIAAPTESPEPSTSAAPLGVVTFGTGFDPEAYAITGSVTRFRATYPRVAFLGTLPEGVGDRVLTVTVSRREGDAETQLVSRELPISNPDRAAYGAVLDGLPRQLGGRAGTYVLRLLVDGTVVSEGQFELVG